MTRKLSCNDLQWTNKKMYFLTGSQIAASFRVKPSVKEVRSKWKRKKTWLPPGKVKKKLCFCVRHRRKNTLLQQDESAIGKFLQNQKYFPRHSWDIFRVIRSKNKKWFLHWKSKFLQIIAINPLVRHLDWMKAHSTSMNESAKPSLWNKSYLIRKRNENSSNSSAFEPTSTSVELQAGKFYSRLDD